MGGSSRTPKSDHIVRRDTTDGFAAGSVVVPPGLLPLGNAQDRVSKKPGQLHSDIPGPTQNVTQVRRSVPSVVTRTVNATSIATARNPNAHAGDTVA